ncbi:MAG TPA: SUMF1/EgtB/PvdO family nonheme iron enzyme [Planctomycetota bacterium]|nr:SUMF1/EgtB/PvdO family nonheme iron enzyme [Planctomycetota bacterium]
MAGISDEALAQYLNQIGTATLDQLEAAKAVQSEHASKGVLLSLGDVLVQQGILTPAMKENVEKKLQAQQTGMQQLGNYRLLKKLGEGGMGAVYLGEDTAMQRKVAIKVLPPKYAADPQFVSRFRREAKAAGKLNHENIVSAFTVGEELGNHYYVMEYCEGEPLDKIQEREQALEWQKAVDFTLQVARGLQHAHQHGIIHRDIKPANIFIASSPSATPGSGNPNGVARILDMGLSKNLAEAEHSYMTQTGIAMGTPLYISPEQARGEKTIDGRTDIYSLGATLYHLLTGQTPFDGSSPALIMMKHLTEELPNPQDVREGIPDSVVVVLQKMMAKDPADRYASCAELIADLELVLSGKMPSSPVLAIGKSSIAMRAVRSGGRRRSDGNSRADRRQEDRRTPAAKSSMPMLIASVIALAGVLIFIFALTRKDPATATSATANQPASVQPDDASKTANAGAKSQDPADRNPQPSDAWVASVQKLPPAAQVDAVVAKLRELNPGYDGAQTHQIIDGRVTELKIESEALSNIWPVRALRDLRFLKCTGVVKGKLEALNNVTDLSALRGLMLERLEITRSRVADLSPLKGMPLVVLTIGNTLVQDLSALKGMSLVQLAFANTPVQSLEPLRGMPLQVLHCAFTSISDLSPLQQAPLKVLYIEGGTRITDLSPLKAAPLEILALPKIDALNVSALGGITTLREFSYAGGADLSGLKQLANLKTINGKPAAEFWMNYAPPPNYKASESLAKEITLDVGNGVKMEFVLIPAGEFMMGSDTGGANEKPVHRVSISRPFYLAKYETTVAQFKTFANGARFQSHAEKLGYSYTMKDGQWQKVEGLNWRTPGFEQGDDSPVISLTWTDVTEYCKRVSRLRKIQFRLPTEAEWEYACRAGTSTVFNNGNSKEDLKEAAWIGENSSGRTQPVGRKKPNAWGLYDMHGNAREWVSDHYSENWYAQSTTMDPKGPPHANAGDERVMRGGGWIDDYNECRSTYRWNYSAVGLGTHCGFRCVLEVPDAIKR